MNAFRALLKCSHSPDTWRSLALFVTFALQDDRAFRNSSLHRSRSNAFQVRLKSSQYLSSPNGRPSPSSSPAREPSPRPGVTRSDLALHMLEIIADLVCDKTTTSTALRFARTVTVRVCLFRNHLACFSNNCAVDVTPFGREQSSSNCTGSQNHSSLADCTWFYVCPKIWRQKRRFRNPQEPPKGMVECSNALDYLLLHPVRIRCELGRF